MKSWAVTIARDLGYQILEALWRAIELAREAEWPVDQIRFEDAYGGLCDVMFPFMPDS